MPECRALELDAIKNVHTLYLLHYVNLSQIQTSQGRKKNVKYHFRIHYHLP